MLKKRIRNSKAFTLIELVIAAVLCGIVFVGIGAAILDNNRVWHAMYNHTFSDVIIESHIARRMFDRIVRKASSKHILLGLDDSWVELYYHHDSASTELDRYARFYVFESELKVEYGSLDPRVQLSTETVCSNVSSCAFMSTGKSVEMILRLDNGSENVTIMSCAVANN